MVLRWRLQKYEQKIKHIEDNRSLGLKVETTKYEQKLNILRTIDHLVLRWRLQKYEQKNKHIEDNRSLGLKVETTKIRTKN